MLNEIYSQRQKKLKENGYSDYKEYLKGDEWKTIRSKVKSRTGAKWNLCNLCTTPNNLEIHHASYKVIGTVNPANTIRLLCRNCHQKVHDLCKLKPKFTFYKAYRWLKKERILNGEVTLTMDVVNEYNRRS